MTVRFHPPEDPDAYAERVLAVLVQAALPRIMERLEQFQAREARENAPVPGGRKP